jgi:ectoine hydroxylase-related dioxygenase (phytanoyl-CoA dioxygenase family)
MDTIAFDLSTSYEITATQADQFKKDGHILLRGVASPEEIEHFGPLITDCVDDLARTRDTRIRLEDESTLFAEVTNVWRGNEEIREFVFAKRFARIAAALMGVRGVRLYHDQATIKDPGGSRTPWHKDHYHWPLATHHTVKMWLALSDITQNMGVMVFASGSHHGGLFPEVPFRLNFQEIFSRVIRDRSVPTPSYFQKPGDAIFYSGDVLHSALENNSTRRREALGVIYYADGTRVMIPDHEHRQIDLQKYLPGLKPGDLAASHLNPLLHTSIP